MSDSRAPTPDAGPLRIAVLASGRGSNLQALIDACAAGTLPARIVGVFSDRSDAAALTRARAAGIPGHACHPRDYPDRAGFDAALFDAIERVAPALIVCAGYMRLISAPAVRRFGGRIVNIHPSLLPKFPGLHTHQRTLDAGDREHGASVHFVIPALDAGPVLAQARVPVHADDSAETLAARVLRREHPLLLASVRLIAAGRVRQCGDTIELDGRKLRSPLRLHDDDLTLLED